MKKLFASIVTIAILMLFVAPVMSEHASPKACFGQARAYYIHILSGKVWGNIASDRAGDNADMNHAYRAGCLPSI